MIMKQKLVLLIALVLALTQGMVAQEIVTNCFIAGEATRLKGDVNGDGQVSIADVTELIDYILGNPSEDFIVENADVDGDGNVAIADITDLIDTILTAATQPTITVSPTDLDFGYVPVGQSMTKTITVTGTNLTGNIALTLAETISGEFTVNKASLSSTGGTVIVTYRPEGAHNSGALITFTSGTTSARVIVNGMGVQPSLTVTPSSINFGNVILGDSITKTFTVTGNNLISDLTLRSTNSSRFKLNGNNSSITLTPDADGSTNQTVSVTYKPTQVQSNGGYIVITGAGLSNDTITLSGKCIAAPSITVTPTSYDFGTVELGNTVTKSFSVVGTNTTGSLVLTSTEMVGGQFTVSPTTLPANGGIVKVTFNPTEVGNHAGMFIVSSSADGVNARATFTGKCVATPSITVTPTTLDFGTVIKGESKSMTFTVKGKNLTGNVSVSSSHSSRFIVNPTVITKTQVESASGAIVTVTYKPTAAATHTGTITVTDGTVTKTVAVTGKCVAPTLTVSPMSLDFGTVAKGSSVIKSFSVMGTNLTENVTITSSNSSLFSVSPTSISKDDSNGANGTVKVTFKPTAAGSFSGTITISSSGISKTVAVTGTCDASTLTVTPMSLDFGTVTLGTSKSQSFTVKGTNLTENVSLAYSGSPYFSFSPTTITKSNATNGATVTVTYHPTAVGTHTGTITITCGSLTKTVTITGTCVAPTLIVTPSTLTFGSMPVGSYKTMTFVVKGTNLTGNVKLTVSGTSDEFTVTPTTITAAEAEAGKTVTAKYSPTTAGTNIATVTISSSGATSKTVNMTGRGTDASSE